MLPRSVKTKKLTAEVLDFYNDVLDSMQQPWKLSHICRRKLRDHVKGVECIDKANLPTRLKSFLNFNDVEIVMNQM